MTEKIKVEEQKPERKTQEKRLEDLSIEDLVYTIKSLYYRIENISEYTEADEQYIAGQIDNDIEKIIEELKKRTGIEEARIRELVSQIGGLSLEDNGLDERDEVRFKSATVEIKSKIQKIIDEFEAKG
jgi:hypothetical protein